MSYANVGAMTNPGPGFLDIAPMITALQYQPSDFEMDHGWLRHVPSRHRFSIDSIGHVSIDARCECSGRSINAEQGDQFLQVYKTWQQCYWQPLQINREFAGHFMKRNAWIRLFRDVRIAWRRFRRRVEPVAPPDKALAMVPAE